MNYFNINYLFIFFGVVVYGQDERDAKLRFYYSSMDSFTELSLEEASRIFLLPWYNASATTVVFAHGFTGRPTGPAINAVISAYLKQAESNVVLLNWEHLAAAVQPNLAGSYVNWAAPNARKLGVRFADTLQDLVAAGLNINRTHLVGHSLGAQIFGIAGNALLKKGLILPWITGLDPASTGFEGRSLQMRLNPQSAEFVSIIHSDPSKYGYSRVGGTVDFWPNFSNGQVRQPGCPTGPQTMFSPGDENIWCCQSWAPLDICSHNRCWELLADAKKHPGFLLGSYARNFRTWKNYSKNDRNAVVLEIGTRPEKIIPGNYYLVTKSTSPYGLGEDGL